jgi:outer membrane protein OmpU
MKKVLIATTALVMTAGVAAAESHIGVKVSGSARMGVTYDGTDAEFSSRVRVVFTMAGETDGGLSFGAETRHDQNSGNTDGTLNGDSTVYIKGAFGKLTMGDVGGAADALVGNVSGVGYGPNDGIQEMGYLNTDKTAAYYEYSTGAFTIGVGAGQPTGLNENVNVGVKYAGSSFTLALGYEDSATDSQLSVGGSAKFGSATVKAVAMDRDTNLDTHFAVSVDFAVSGATITAFAVERGADASNQFGLGAAYDLGGGATFAAGVADNGTDTVGDVGLKFSF